MQVKKITQNVVKLSKKCLYHQARWTGNSANMYKANGATLVSSEHQCNKNVYLTIYNITIQVCSVQQKGLQCYGVNGHMSDNTSHRSAISWMGHSTDNWQVVPPPVLWEADICYKSLSPQMQNMKYDYLLIVPRDLYGICNDAYCECVECIMEDKVFIM